MISTRFGGLAFGRAGWVGVDGRLRDPFFFHYELGFAGS
jgi:hypothetical protein